MLGNMNPGGNLDPNVALKLRQGQHNAQQNQMALRQGGGNQRQSAQPPKVPGQPGPMQMPGPANSANMTNNSSVSINQKQQALRMQSQRQNTQQTMEPKPSHMHVAGQM
jgi:hypothetical protein